MRTSRLSRLPVALGVLTFTTARRQHVCVLNWLSWLCSLEDKGTAHRGHSTCFIGLTSTADAMMSTPGCEHNLGYLVSAEELLRLRAGTDFVQ
ncbi:hypothetical protein VTK56DRAFT_1721 [Thermocarpiscus australiensis]